ncbi:TPA: phage tail fiber protein [Citrobacter koseri]
MSVPNQTPYIIYNANGLTTVFPFEFYIINAGDIQISINGTVVTSGYSVTGVGNIGGGDVTFLTPPASGNVVMLERVVPTYRLTDYQDNGDLLADTVNKDFDRLWMAIQRSFIYLGLALRRPLLGGPFNAEGYRIANLGEPVDSQDAATKNYVDQVGQTNLNRVIRVPESYVNPVPTVAARKNMVFAWNGDGNPIAVLPQSGSASDVMIELAKPTGTNLIGYGSDILTNSISRTLKSFGAVGDGVANDTAALLLADVWSISTGKPVRVTNGVYKVLNLQLGGTYIADDGAIIYGEIGATDNVLIPKTGFRMTGGTIRKKQTDWALNGAYGNCVRIGDYEQPSDGSTPVYDVFMENVTMDAVKTSYTNQALEILGDAYDITLINCTAKGPVGAALIAHWGGDVGTTGNNQNVTYSFHPHGLYITNFRCEKDEEGYVPGVGVILASCYDVTIDGLYGMGMDRLLDVTPGDVYNEVAVSRDKDMPCTGIRIRGVYADGPKATNTGIPCIRVTGAPQASRTSKTQYWGIDYNAKYDVSVEYTIRAYDVVFSLPLVLVNFCSNAKVEGTIIGGGRSSVWLHQTDCNRDCDFQVSSATAVASFLRDRGSRNSRFVVDIQRDKSFAYSSTHYGIEPQTFVSGAFVTDAAAAIGATSINIRGGAADGIIMAGSLIRNAAGGILGKLLKTVRVIAGAANITTVQTTPLTSAIGSALNIKFNLEEEGTTFTGSVSGFMRNVNMDGTRGVTFKNMSFTLAQHSHVYMQGDCRDISFEGCQFSGANMAADNVEPYDITCISSATLSRINIRNCRFETEYLSSVAVGVYWPTVNNSACSISASVFGTLSTAGVSVTTSTVSSAYNMLSQYDNFATSGTTLSRGTPPGMYVGSRFVGEDGAIPTDGFWKRGDIIRTTTPVASGQEGWLCVGSGTPGTWKGMGSISA